MADAVIKLPPPQKTGPLSLEEAIALRRSARRFAPRELALAEIGQLAWAAQGITGRDARWRSAPSAGALHSLTLYALYQSSAYRYEPAEHHLVLYRPIDMQELAAASLNQPFIADAGCTFLFTGLVERTTRVYKKRARDYICMDLGHAAENLLLQAVSLQLAAVPVGAFDRVQVHELLALPKEEEPLYLVPVGFPA